MNITFKFVEHDSPSWKKAVQLRETILRIPLGDRFSHEELAEEKNHYHVVGILNEKLIATAVLVPENKELKMQRVVVLDAYRNTNIGSEMIQFCEHFAIEKQIETIYCHARDSAVRFYFKNGYLKAGDYFDEDGIPHLKMYKTLNLSINE